MFKSCSFLFCGPFVAEHTPQGEGGSITHGEALVWGDLSRQGLCTANAASGQYYAARTTARERHCSTHSTARLGTCGKRVCFWAQIRKYCSQSWKKDLWAFFCSRARLLLILCSL